MPSQAAAHVGSWLLASVKHLQQVPHMLTQASTGSFQRSFLAQGVLPISTMTEGQGFDFAAACSGDKMAACACSCAKLLSDLATAQDITEQRTKKAHAQLCRSCHTSSPRDQPMRMTTLCLSSNRQLRD